MESNDREGNKQSRALGWCPRLSSCQILLAGVPGNVEWIREGQYDAIVKLTGAMWGTTPPWEITTFPRSFCNLDDVAVRHDWKWEVRIEWDSLFVVSDGKLQVTGYNTLLLVIPSGVASKFENLSSEILKNSSEVYWKKGKLATWAEMAKTNCTNQVHQLQHVERSYPSSRDGEHDRLGTGDQPWPSEIGTLRRSHHQQPCLRICQLFLYQTLLMWVCRWGWWLRCVSVSEVMGVKQEGKVLVRHRRPVFILGEDTKERKGRTSQTKGKQQTK